MKENLHDGHRKRLRELANKTEFKNLEQHQVLELLLTYVIPRKDTNPIAHRLIKQFGSFSAVLDAKIEDLIKVEGVGEATANFLVSIKHFFFAYNKFKVGGTYIINCTIDAVNYIKPYLENKTVEEFYVICLDSANKVKVCQLINSGSVNKTDVDVRKVVETIFKCNSANVIICHNHPEGNATPSFQDDKLTKAITTTLKLNGINLLDHIIYGNGEYYSYSKSGAISRYVAEVNDLISSPIAMQKPCKYN